MNLLTTKEVASRRKCSTRTVEAERQRGDGPPYLKIRAQVLYPEEELEAWLREHLVASTAEADVREAGHARTAD